MKKPVKRYADRHAKEPKVIEKIIYVKQEPGEGRIELKQEKDGLFYFVLKSKNGKIIAKSNGYAHKDSCIEGIRHLKGNANSEVIDKTLKK